MVALDEIALFDDAWLEKALTPNLLCVHVSEPTPPKTAVLTAPAGCTVTMIPVEGDKTSQYFPGLRAHVVNKAVVPRVPGVPVVVDLGGALYLKAHPPDLRESLEMKMKRLEAERRAKAKQSSASGVGVVSV